MVTDVTIMIFAENTNGTLMHRKNKTQQIRRSIYRLKYIECIYIVKTQQSYFTAATETPKKCGKELQGKKTRLS